MQLKIFFFLVSTLAPTICLEPLATSALMSGIVGLTVDQLTKEHNYVKAPSTGGCSWFGTSPICSGECPRMTVSVKSSQTFFLNNRLSFRRRLDKSYGEPCLIGNKVFCCHVDENDRSWEGVYQAAIEDGGVYNCAFHVPVESEPSYQYTRRCGVLHCSQNTEVVIQFLTIVLDGPTCTDLTLLSINGETTPITGKATLGHIVWLNHGRAFDSWYKSQKPK